MRNGNLFKLSDSEIHVKQIRINQGVVVQLKKAIVKNFLKILGKMCHGVRFKLLHATSEGKFPFQLF